jgi:hypothetical protein
VPVGRSDELAAVLVSELQRDVAGVEPEHVPGVPAEVVPGGEVELDVTEPRRAAHAVPVMGADLPVRCSRDGLNNKPALVSPLEWWGSRGEDPVVGVRFVARRDGDQGRLCEGPAHEFETDREAMRGEPSRHNHGGKATGRG